MCNILIIYTGGTIGMIKDSQNGMLKPFNFTQITENLPELNRLGFSFYIHSLSPAIDSSNIYTDNWIELIEVIEQNYDKYEGFVILHGTDTMSFSASALSFAFENLDKPIIFTGSQLPISEIRTDAKENLLTAMQIAMAKKADGSPMVTEVCVYFDFMLYRGNRSTKIDSERFQAFTSVNYPILAEAGVRLNFFEKNILKPENKSLKIHKNFDTSVISIKLFPGIQQSSYLEKIIEIDGLKAIILEAYGSGNAPTQKQFLALLKKAIDKGILIIDISQCMGGSVILGNYETSSYLSDIGVISGYDMTYETAITKTMFVLGQSLPLEEQKKMIITSLRGELTY